MSKMEKKEKGVLFLADVIRVKLKGQAESAFPKDREERLFHFLRTLSYSSAPTFGDNRPPL